MPTTLPSTIYSKLIDKVTFIFKKYDMHHSHQELILRRDADLVVGGIEEIIRECVSREILAWHDLECDKDVIDCNCKDLAEVVAGKMLGEHIEF